MVYFIALIFGLLAYVVVKFLLSKVDSLAGIAEIGAVIAGFLVALFYIGAI